MFSGGSSPICQRCRLRETILQLQLRRQARPSTRSFTSQAHHSQEFGQDLIKRRDKGVVYKHFDGKGKVIGRPGRRQRAVSEKLSTKALDERVSPSQIIIFQDVKYEPRPPRPFKPTQDGLKQRVLSAREIEDSVKGHLGTPEEAEVGTSIDELRPRDTVVDESGFEKLKQKLLKGYNYGQLSRYLVSRISDGSPTHTRRQIGKGLNELSTSQWQPGETPLEKRHKNQAKTNRSNSKLGVVDQILRLVWDITVQSEVQGTGELEIRLQPWQLSMLFDLPTSDGKPYYERFITPPILLEASRLHQYQPHNIVRVVGRRQVAEEVAKQLRLAVLGMAKLELDLEPFVSTTPKADNTTASKTIFNDDDLRFVSDLTKCIIIPERGNCVTICGYDAQSRRNAQRTLLSLLGLPSASSFDEVSTTGFELIQGMTKSTMIAADVVDSGLHRKHRNLHASRISTPVSRAQPGNASESSLETTKLVQRLTRQMDHIPETNNGSALWTHDASSYWRNEIRLSEWEARLCRLLDGSTIEPDGGRRQAKPRIRPTSDSILQRVITGSDALLSYFTPNELPRPLNLQMGEKRGKTVFDRRLPFLNAHFVPCPPVGPLTTKLPRISMRFRFSAPTNTEAPRELMLLGLRAEVDQQRFKVPLPRETMDLVFTRHSSMISNLSIANQDRNIRQWCAHLKESVRLGQGALDGPSSLTIRLPRYFIDGDKDASEDVEVQYMFARFEQVQALEFAPSQDMLEQEGTDREVAELINNLPENAYLYYRESDGGAVYGNSTALSLRIPQPKPTTSMNDEVGSNLSKHGFEMEAMTQSEAVSQIEHNESVSHEQVNTADQKPQVTQTIGGNTEGNVEEPTGDVQAVEGNAKSSIGRQANTSSGLVEGALRIAGLLTRASSGSLKRLGGR